MSARVRTIAPGAPFLTTLVGACRDGSLGINFPADSRDYSAATIFVPTRRAARALAHAFMERPKPLVGQQPVAVLLPRIVPLGDPADLEVSDILAGDGWAAGPETPPAIGDLDRRLLLSGLVEAWRKSRDLAALAMSEDGFSVAGGFGDSFSLAGDLAKLLDEFAIEGADWNRVKTLADDRFDRYWAMTREFLAIAGEHWPEALSARGCVDPGARLDRLLRGEAERLRWERPDSPIIAAGSTGTVPATAELLDAIARLPNGVVVLPGLDRALDEPGWAQIADQPQSGEAQPGHPQAALKRLLGRLRVAREEVLEIGRPEACIAARAAVMNGSARPAGVTDDWPKLREAMAGKIGEGLDGVAVVEAPDERMEALAVAVALRGILEQDGKTAALVTPDRALARRVALELRRWGIAADDSAGSPLGDAPLGGFAWLVIAAALADFAPAPTMAVLSHVCAGSDETALHALELAGFRGNGPARGLAGVAAALDGAEARIADRRAARPLGRVTADALQKARSLLADFAAAMAPLAAPAGEPRMLREMALAHAAAIQALARDRAAEGSDGAALGRLFDEIAAVDANPRIALADYSACFDALASERVIAPTQPAQGRIKIWGLLEARLMEADLIVLGGLNEGVWPPEVRSDAFLNRAMRSELGLAPPEQRIGQSAHDFIQAICAPEAVVVRARTVEGAPMVASRFVRRLDAFVGESMAAAMRSRGAWLLAAAEALDEARPAPSAPRPEPKPDVALQPTSLSVTEIGKLFRDPYAIYAKHVLALDRLEPLETEIDARDRGKIIHDVLAGFVEDTQNGLPADPLSELLARGERAFAELKADERVEAFWKPVFERVARWFVAWEAERRGVIEASLVERSGSLHIKLADGVDFRLRGRADRIDVLRDGGLAVIDYKTGAPPGGGQVARGLEPQLTLTAHMAAEGAYPDVPALPVQEIAYVRVGSKPEFAPVKLDNRTIATPEQIAAKAELHISALKSMLDDLRGHRRGYKSRRLVEKAGATGDYDHLARAKEWLAEEAE